MYVCIHIHVYTYFCVYICVYIHMYIYIHKCARAHTHAQRLSLN